MYSLIVADRHDLISITVAWCVAVNITLFFMNYTDYLKAKYLILSFWLLLADQISDTKPKYVRYSLYISKIVVTALVR